MTHTEFAHLLATLPAFSPEQLRQLQREVEVRLAPAVEASFALTAAEQTDRELQHRLYALGMVSEIKPPRRSTGRKNFTPVPIQGEPLSETVIRERR